MNSKLSPRQQAIMEYLQEYIDEHGFAPSYREIAKAANLKSASTVMYQLNALVARGLIKHKEGSVRAISLVNNGNQ